MQGYENLLSPGRSRSMRSPMAVNPAGSRSGLLLKLRGGTKSEFGQHVREAREAFEASMALTMDPTDTMLKLHLGCLLTIYVTNNWRLVERGQGVMRKCMVPFHSAIEKIKEKVKAKAERQATYDPSSEEALFEMLDTNHDGVISRDEFEQALRSGRLQEEDVERLESWVSHGSAELEDMDEEELEQLAEQQRLEAEEQLRFEEEQLLAEQERQQAIAEEQQRQALIRAEQKRRASIEQQYRKASVFASTPPSWSGSHRSRQEYQDEVYDEDDY